MVFFVRITVNQSHLRPICKSTKFNPKIQRTIYLINFQQLRLHVPDFIRTVVEYEFKISSKIGCLRLISAIFEWNSFTEGLRTRTGEEGCGRRCRQREALSASQQHQRKQRIFMAQQRNSYGQRRQVGQNAYRLRRDHGIRPSVETEGYPPSFLSRLLH